MGVLQKAQELLEKERQAEKQAKEKSDNTVGDNTVMETPDDWWADENSDEDQTVVADESPAPVSEEQSEYDSPEREEFRKEIINKYLKQPPEGWDNMSTSEKEDFIHGLLKDAGEKFFPRPEGVSDEEEVDVPEIETEITDLPPEDENEKVLDVDRTVVEEQPEVEEEPFDESSVMDPEEPGETEISEEELENAIQEMNKEEEPKPVEDKEIDEELQKLGYKKEKPKSEDTKNTTKDTKNTTNKNQKSSSQYKHVPTPLRMAEDAGKATQTVLEDIGHVADTIGKQGTSGTSINDDVRSAVPHYDYRSLFR